MMGRSMPPRDGLVTRPFLPPPIETLALDGMEENQRRLELRRSYESGYQAGLAEGQAVGHAEGLRDARAEAALQVAEGVREGAERSQREGVAVLNAALAELAARHAAHLAAQERGLREALVAALRALAPRLALASAADELSALLAEAMARRGAALVTLRAHPETLAQLPEGAASDAVCLRPDPGMRKNTAEASWSTGGLVFDAADLTERVLAVLTPPADPASPLLQENPA